VAGEIERRRVLVAKWRIGHGAFLAAAEEWVVEALSMTCGGSGR